MGQKLEQRLGLQLRAGKNNRRRAQATYSCGGAMNYRAGYLFLW
jgi:hypothetical protein